MTSSCPTKIEQFAIEAKLNLVFGAKVYDRVFLGFEVLAVVDGELRAWSPSEHCAAVIDVQYSAEVAWIAQTVFNKPIRRVSVLVRGMSHDTSEQPDYITVRTGSQSSANTPQCSSEQQRGVKPLDF